jgi:signal transduction histidine kinase
MVNTQVERIIDGLLTLISSEQRVTKAAPVDLADIARHIHSHLEPALTAGDPPLLERLIQNLADNAIRYNLPEHGRIRSPLT